LGLAILTGVFAADLTDNTPVRTKGEIPAAARNSRREVSVLVPLSIKKIFPAKTQRSKENQVKRNWLLFPTCCSQRLLSSLRLGDFAGTGCYDQENLPQRRKVSKASQGTMTQRIF
jgi:hypothetical protein